MTQQTVLHNPDPKLRQVAEPVSVSEIESVDFQKLIDDMIETMALEKGVGLAAIQIGVQKRLLIAQTANGPEAFINPEIIKTSKKMVESEEGCLSVPGIFGLVKRHKHIKVKALKRDGSEVEIKTGGLLSIIFQHEIDHLDGILFIDKAYELKEEESENNDNRI